MPRTVMRDVGDRLRAVLILGLVTVCALAVALVPDWESDLGAQTYEEFTSIGAEALRDAEAERKVLTNRLDESRKETHARKWGVFATFERNTIRRSPSDRGNGYQMYRKPIGGQEHIIETSTSALGNGWPTRFASFIFDIFRKQTPQRPEGYGRSRFRSFREAVP